MHVGQQVRPDDRHHDQPAVRIGVFLSQDALVERALMEYCLGGFQSQLGLLQSSGFDREGVGFANGGVLQLGLKLA